MQFSTAGLGWEVLAGADADGSSVAPLIGGTQTGLYTAATPFGLVLLQVFL